MYLAGNRQQRQWLIMAAHELELMPTTEAGLDFQLDLTHAMDGYPGIEHNLPVYPLYQRRRPPLLGDESPQHPDPDRLFRRPDGRDLLVHP